MVDSYPDALKRLVSALSRLPGVGPKTAQRLAFFLIKSSPSEVEELVDSLRDISMKVHLCEICGYYTDETRCAICRDSTRDKTVICVVEKPQDVLVIEKTGYRGVYHVLQGAISPLSGVSPEDLTIDRLLARLHGDNRQFVQEVILATNPSLDGEATALFIARKLKPLSIRTTLIARGLPLGGDLEFTDEITLSQALEGRREIVTV
ncbi:MAG TPA: recombination mediator RecR [Atribacteraceae bacterium]|nr:recombination mediator RecR [Atribacteraceae bacterium]